MTPAVKQRPKIAYKSSVVAEHFFRLCRWWRKSEFLSDEQIVTQKGRSIESDWQTFHSPQNSKSLIKLHC